MLDQHSLNQLADLIAERVATKLATEQKRFVTRKEYAQIHGISERTVDRAIDAGKLTVRRLGRIVRIPADAKIATAS